MKHSLIFHSGVKADVRDAYIWYEETQDGLGFRLLTELHIRYDQIEEHPEYYSKIGKSLRKILLSRFPYLIAFEIIGPTVFGYAVFHTNRNPKEKNV